MKTKTDDNKPPESARHVWGVSGLSRDRSPATYTIEHADGSVTHHILSKRRRQVMDLLMRSPVYCASPVRISDIVHLLKRETGVDIHTEYYAGDPETGAGAFGVYFLKSKVRRVVSAKEAA